MSNINRGSMWHKWDLHVHTPCSIVQDYGGDNDQSWERFISDLENLPEEVKVIGINDYLFIDGYRKVLEYKHKGRLSGLDLILPVIEFRLKSFVGHEKLKKINYHVIFADESILDPDIIDQQFLSCLYGKAKLDPKHSEGVWSGIVNRDSLRDLGEKIRNTIPAGKRDGLPSDLEIGFQNISFESGDIADALGQGGVKNSFLEKNFLTAIGKSEWEGFKWNHGSVADKKTVINDCDFVFTASKFQTGVLNAKDRLASNQVNSRLLHCSDAHDYSSSQEETNKLGHCFTWIKADLTFEGLKQVVYEPEERVCIQQLEPESDKVPSVVIDRIEYQNEGSQEEVFFNQNLNSLVGVRGSGKSNLLKNIVFASDKAEYEKRGLGNDDRLPMNNLQIVWKDGEKFGDDEEEIGDRKILFIPQKYLGSKVYEGEGGSNEMVDQFVTELLSENLRFKNTQEAFNKIRSERTKKIGDLLEDLLLSCSNVRAQEEEIKKYPEKKVLESQIKMKVKNLEKIKKEADLSDDDLEKYKNLSEKRADFDAQVAQHKNDINLYKELKKAGIVDASNLLSDFDFSDDERKSITSHVKKSENLGKNFIKGRVQKITEILNDANERIKEIDKDIFPIQEKIKKNKEVEKIAMDIRKGAEDLKKLLLIIARNKKEMKKKADLVDEIKGVYDKAVGDLSSCFGGLNIERLPEDIAIEFDVRFDDRSFEEFLKKVNRKTLSQDLREEVNSNLSEVDDIGKIINKLFDGVLSGEVSLNKETDLKECLSDLFSFRYGVDYLSGIKNKEGVILKNMSAGQKMLILLSLIFSFDGNRYPILIDQPEDDLDSTTISEIVSSFLKKQKKNRQIIIASHNANLVICADSEEVLVANNENGNFTYESGSIENPRINKRIVEILEGGEDALRKRRDRYQF